MERKRDSISVESSPFGEKRVLRGLDLIGVGVGVGMEDASSSGMTWADGM